MPPGTRSSFDTAAPDNPSTVESLTEDQALALLQQPDLAPEELEKIGKQSALLRSRKVKLAIIRHGRTPRHVSLAIARGLLTFDLMRVALEPLIPGDIKVAAEEALIKRLETVTSGEKLSLARRASGRVAAALLLDPDERVLRVALDNPRLTETIVVRALSGGTSTAVVQSVCHHPKWSLRQDIRIALLRSPHTPLTRAKEFAKTFPAARLREILQGCSLHESVRSRLLEGEES